METTEQAKPDMSRTEASFHETVAGQRASQKAEAIGSNPQTVAAVVEASAGAIEVAGYKLRPAVQGTLFVLQNLAVAFEEWCEGKNLNTTGDPTNPGELELYEIALSTLVFVDPRRVARTLKEQNGLDKLIAEAESITWDIPLEDSLKLNQHFTSEMLRIKQLSGEDDQPAESVQRGKPQPSSVSPQLPTASQEMQTAPKVADWRSANG